MCKKGYRLKSVILPNYETLTIYSLQMQIGSSKIIVKVVYKYTDRKKQQLSVFFTG